MLEWHFWMQMVLLNDPVVIYRDIFTYSTLTQPKTCRGLTPLVTWMMLSILLAMNFWFVFYPYLIYASLIEPWQHAGLVCEGLWVRSLLTPYLFFSFWFFLFLFPFFQISGWPPPLFSKVLTMEFLPVICNNSKIILIYEPFICYHLQIFEFS